MNKNRFYKFFPILIYLILIAYIFQFRYKLDKFGPYFTSDGAIKIYQTFQYKENGFLSLECYYPGKSLDPDFKFYPISYPWAIFDDKHSKEKCVLEYPPFYYWLGAFLLKFIPLGLLLYLPLVFYSVAIFLFDKLLFDLGFKSLFRIFIVTLSFFSFPLLTSIDYTESSCFLLIYLAGFSRIVYHLRKTERVSGRDYLFTGALLGFSFLLRLEIIVPFAYLLLVYLILYRNIRNPFLIGIGFSSVIALFLLYNFFISGHVLGFRYVSSIDLNENASADFLSRVHLLKAYLFGDHVMIGVFQFNPLCYFIILIFAITIISRKNSKEGNVFLLAGFLSIVSIPFYVTFYGGVGYFGLRYLEAPFYLIVIGFSFYFVESQLISNRFYRWIMFVILGFIFYFNLVSTREGLKVLRNSSSDLHTLHSEFNKSPRFVIHTSLYSSIWMGNSFLNRIHVLAYDSKMLEDYLNKINRKEIFLIIQSPKDIYISSDIPKKLYGRYLTSVELPLDKIQITKVTDLFGVKLIVAKRR